MDISGSKQPLSRTALWYTHGIITITTGAKMLMDMKTYKGISTYVWVLTIKWISNWSTFLQFLPCDALRCTVFVIVILSVCLSVRLSVTLVDCVHMVRPTTMISWPHGSLIILVSGDIKFIPKFEGEHPERWTRVGWVRIGNFWPISRRISETVRDTTKVIINHW